MSGIVHLEQEIEQLTQERDAALARVAQLEAKIADREHSLDVCIETINDASKTHIQLIADLQAARTAAELAAKHREQLEQLIRDYQRDDSKDLNSQCHCHLCKRASALLSEVKS